MAARSWWTAQELCGLTAALSSCDSLWRVDELQSGSGTRSRQSRNLPSTQEFYFGKVHRQRLAACVACALQWHIIMPVADVNLIAQASIGL